MDRPLLSYLGTDQESGYLGVNGAVCWVVSRVKSDHPQFRHQFVALIGQSPPTGLTLPDGRRGTETRPQPA